MDLDGVQPRARLEGVRREGARGRNQSRHGGDRPHAHAVETRAGREHGDRLRWQEYVRYLPQGRAAEPREIADAVVFLASDRASYISGTVLTIDGGTLHRR